MSGDQMDRATTLPVLLGAGGGVGRLIRRGWAEAGLPASLLAHRRAGTRAGLIWNMAEAPPGLDRAGRPVVLNFAGVTPRSAQGDLCDNTTLAVAALRAGRAWNAAHVFVASSSAVYGPTGDAPVPETAALRPRGAYGRAKAEMEEAVLAARRDGDPAVTVLRIGNVAGAGQPVAAARRAPGPVTLDRFGDGTGPSRSFIGPVALARTLWQLCAAAERGAALPPILNVAAPVPTAMADILDALGRDWGWAPAPEAAIARVHLDTARLQALCPLPEAAGRAGALVAELRQVGGWP